MKILIATWLVAAAASAQELPKPSLVNEVENQEKETILADSIGKTLYIFDLDENQPAPKCTGDCAEVWPPYILSADEAKDLEKPLGSIARKNSKLQLTYNGKPVYTYIFDRVVGDDKGDGVGKVWHYIEIEKPDIK
jgi:predicted lipoprotein with Yx(FWY)xxD motif